MIQSITVTNYRGESKAFKMFAPEESGFLITRITGLGPAKASINSTEIATRDGGFFNSSRTQSRNIVVTFKLLPKQTIEDVRLMSYRYFPVKKPLTLMIETDNRLCLASGYVESNEPDIFSRNETTQISIICPDPYLYSLSVQNTVFFGVEPKFEFPFSNGSLSEPMLRMGEIVNKLENTIVYDGESEIGMTIRIHSLGTASNIHIYNVVTREEMFVDTDILSSLFGTHIIKGDDLVITTIKGRKSVALIREGIGYNILNCLSRDSDWFQLAKGDNIFAYTADSGAENLQFTIQNQTAYEGV